MSKLNPNTLQYTEQEDEEEEEEEEGRRRTGGGLIEVREL